MTIFNGNNASVPLEEVHQPLLQDFELVAYYLLDAISCLSDEPDSLTAALKDTICANRVDYTLPLTAIFACLKFLDAPQLQDLTDFLEEELAPPSRTRLADYGIFVCLREFSKMKQAGYDIVLEEISDGWAPPPQGVKQATLSLQAVWQTDAYYEMEKILSPS